MVLLCLIPWRGASKHDLRKKLGLWIVIMDPLFAEKSPNCRFLLGTITCCFIAEISLPPPPTPLLFMKCLFHISYGHLQGRLCFGKFWRKVKMAPWLVLPTLSTDRVKSLNLRRSPESISASFFFVDLQTSQSTRFL